MHFTLYTLPYLHLTISSLHYFITYWRSSASLHTKDIIKASNIIWLNLQVHHGTASQVAPHLIQLTPMHGATALNHENITWSEWRRDTLIHPCRPLRGMRGRLGRAGWWQVRHRCHSLPRIFNKSDLVPRRRWTPDRECMPGLLSACAAPDCCNVSLEKPLRCLPNSSRPSSPSLYSYFTSFIPPLEAFPYPCLL